MGTLVTRATRALSMEEVKQAWRNHRLLVYIYEFATRRCNTFGGVFVNQFAIAVVSMHQDLPFRKFETILAEKQLFEEARRRFNFVTFINIQHKKSNA